MNEHKNVGYQETRSDEEIILGLKYDARQRAREEYVDEKDTHSGRMLVLIERLIRERDVAMATAEKANTRWIEMIRVVGEAEARGFERGVREAKEAAWRAWTASGDVGKTGGKMYAEILALLQKPTETKQP
jgi:hypothetical protein